MCWGKRQPKRPTTYNMEVVVFADSIINNNIISSTFLVHCQSIIKKSSLADIVSPSERIASTSFAAF